jgi:hexosaminidase
MAWQADFASMFAVQGGHDLVQAPISHCYFNFAESTREDKPVVGQTLPIDSLYLYEPVYPSFSEEQARQVLGVQGCLWTEQVHTPERMEYLLLPRLAALAELAWSPTLLRDMHDFSTRLSRHYLYLM